MESTRAQHTCKQCMQRSIQNGLSAHRSTRPLAQSFPPVRATWPLRLQCGRNASTAGAPANDAVVQLGESGESHNAKAGPGWRMGGCDKGVTIRTGQGWSSRVERGRDQVYGLARYLQGAHRSLCAPLVRSSSSQLEHIDLEPEPVEKTEMRRRSSRRSHHLRSKRARRIAVREPNAAARSVGTRRAVTRAVRGEGAHMLEQISHVLRWYPSRPSRSSAAGRVAPDHTFRAAETPGGSHGGPQQPAASASTTARSLRPLFAGLCHEPAHTRPHRAPWWQPR